MRSVSFLTIAAFVTFLLFWVMQKLIVPAQHVMTPVDNFKVIPTVLAKPQPEKEPDTVQKNRESAKPLQSPDMRPLFNIDMPRPDFEGVQVRMPELVLAPNLSVLSNWSDGIVAVSGGGSNLYGTGSGSGEGHHHIEIIPHGTIQPEYPETAARRKIEGWVKVEFTINEGGWVEDVVILDADPKGIFEQTTVKAVQAWKYRPIPTEIRASQYIEFTLDQLQYYQGK